MGSSNLPGLISGNHPRKFVERVHGGVIRIVHKEVFEIMPGGVWTTDGVFGSILVGVLGMFPVEAL